MIAYLNGKLTFKSPTMVYMDIGGIAYEVLISLNTYSEIEKSENAKLYTQLIVREDSQTIYGFYDVIEKNIFKQLVSVSGIGPNTARVILSYMTVKEAQTAIVHENVAAFKKVKGVGPKTAQRIILDLKDKIGKELLKDNVQLSPNMSAANNIREEATAALTALGFQKAQIQKHIDKTLSSHQEITQVEQLIKVILRSMS